MNDNELKVLESLQDTHWWYLIRKFILKRFLTKNLARDSEILEIGSATGGNTLWMLSLGYKVNSLEFSFYGVNVQRKKGIQVTQGDARKIPFPNDRFDAVVCMDVLEHIHEDYMVLSEIHRVLRPGGKFLISVPEDPSMWSAHDVAADHVRRYKVSELVEKIVGAKLNCSSIWRTNFILKLLVRLRRKTLGGSDLTPMNHLINKSLLLISHLDYFLSSSKIPGITAWVAGKKS